MAQQFINTGTTAGDGSGTELRPGGVIINENFTELYNSLGDQLAGTTKINSLADFPAPAGGVIELTGGADKVYVFDSRIIDIGANRFTVTGGSCIFIGSSRFSSTILSSTIGNLFTTSNAHFSIEFANLDSPGSPFLVNYSGVTLTSFVLNNVVVFGCKKIFTVAGAFTTSLRTLTIVNTSIGGMEWTGTANSQLNLSTCLGIGWTGALIDYTPATFDLIVMTSDNRFLSPAGTTILKGAASSANINPGGRALISDCLFNGTGTPLSGITTQDLQYRFNSNVFVDGITKNTRDSAEAFISTTTTAPTAAAGSDVFVAIGGVNWASDVANHWTVSTAGLMTYIGLDDMDFNITHHSSGAPSTGAAVRMRTQISKSGTLKPKTIGSATDNSAAGMSGGGLFSVSNGDTIQLFAAVTGTVDIDFETSNITITVAR